MILFPLFFDKKNNKDIEYQDIDNFVNCFDDFGTCNLFIEKVKIGIILEKVMILLSYNGQIGDITINFLESQFEIDGSPDLSDKFSKSLFVQTLYHALKSY